MGELVLTGSRTYLVIEYLGGGDLSAHVQSRTKALYPEEAASFLLQLSCALEHCKEHNVVHRDIKLENVVLNADKSTVKLADFGLSQQVRSGGRLSDFCGTLS